MSEPPCSGPRKSAVPAPLVKQSESAVHTPVNALTIRVRTNQTDLNGVMYHGSYFDCFEAARVDVFRSLGYTFDRTRREGFVPVISQVACEYLLPAYFDDLINVRVMLREMTAASMLLGYHVSREADYLARGEAKFVFLSIDHGRPIRIPTSLRLCVEQYRDLLSPQSRTTSSH